MMLIGGTVFVSAQLISTIQRYLWIRISTLFFCGVAFSKVFKKTSVKRRKVFNCILSKVKQLCYLRVLCCFVVAFQGKKGLFTVQSLMHRTEMQRGRELPRFPNYDMFEKIVQEYIVRYHESAEQCLHSMVRATQTLLNHIATSHLGQIPLLLARVIDEADIVMDDCVSDAQSLIKFTFEKENLVYSQDAGFLEVLGRLSLVSLFLQHGVSLLQRRLVVERLDGVLAKEACDKMRRSLQVIPRYGDLKDEESSEKNAQSLQGIIECYLSVRLSIICTNIVCL